MPLDTTSCRPTAQELCDRNADLTSRAALAGERAMASAALAYDQAKEAYDRAVLAAMTAELMARNVQVQRAITARALRLARKLIAEPRHWTRDSFSRRRWVGAAYCAYGAVREVSGANTPTTLRAWLALDNEAMSLGFRSAAEMNDHTATNHGDILNLFDVAIAKMEGANAV